jgi:hypothetical protein
MMKINQTKFWLIRSRLFDHKVTKINHKPIRPFFLDEDERTMNNNKDIRVYLGHQ